MAGRSVSNSATTNPKSAGRGVAPRTGVAIDKVAEPPMTKRLGLNLPPPVYDEVNQLAKERRSSMTEIVRLALGLIKIVIREANKGNKLIITTPSGDPLREIVLP